MQEIVPPRGWKPIPLRQLPWVVLGSALALAGGAFGIWGAASASQLVGVGDHLVLARFISGTIGVGLLLLGCSGVCAMVTGGNKTPRYVADDEGLALWWMVQASQQERRHVGPLAAGTIVA